MREIAANYIYLPKAGLIKNAYISYCETGFGMLTDPGIGIREIQGLEFYGGIIVAGYVKRFASLFHDGAELLSVLDEIYQNQGKQLEGLCIIEGADLVNLKWTASARIRVLC